MYGDSGPTIPYGIRSCKEMATEYSGRGDPARSMALLWGTQKPPTRGPKHRLSVGAMSLYTYVPGKAELLDVMLDTVLGELAAPDGGAEGWRAKLELSAREHWALYHRHPWVLQVSGARALLGPNETAQFEATLRAVSGVGLTGKEMVLVVSL